jgi:succinyl-diaminopimelate desuccinylase
VTPADDGALAVLAAALSPLGFAIHHVPFGTTPNLVAVWGEGSPHLCFAGHTDVVPPGPFWAHDPFGGQTQGGVLYGRGACDMKGAIAAFIAATETVLRHSPKHGRLSLLITGDEEGPATDGTVRVLDWMAERGLTPDACLVGEPTNPTVLGETIKIGRRGSLNATVTVHGTQGHVAYPHRADNPVHRLVALLAALTAAPIDDGTKWFEPSGLQITSIDVGNPAANVIPGSATARLNIRFNDRHTGETLAAWLRAKAASHAPHCDLDVTIGGEAFLTKPTPFTDAVAAAITHVTGRVPRLDTGGGTSDARFISRFCPVAEFGLVGASMHKTDEHVALDDLRTLTAIYADIIRRVLA